MVISMRSWESAHKELSKRDPDHRLEEPSKPAISQADTAGGQEHPLSPRKLHQSLLLSSSSWTQIPAKHGYMTYPITQDVNPIVETISNLRISR